MTPELDLDGPAAPPRVNGELAFEHPWQGRLFATTMALCDAGRLDYAVFRDRLIAAIGAAPAAPVGGTSTNDSYWGAWQDALEAELEAHGLCDPTELASRSTAFAQHH